MKRLRRMNAFNPSTVERAVREHGISMNAFLEMADINKSTWNRWQHKANEPNMSTLRRVYAALDKLEKKKRRT